MTDSLARLLEDLLADKMSEIMTSVPARIESYNSLENTASVQPLLQSKKNSKVSKLPVLANVPCEMYYRSGFLITNDYKKGDLVRLSFCTHSIQKAITGQLDTSTKAPFNPSDCFVSASYISKSNINPNRTQLMSKDGLVIGHEDGGAFIHIKKNEIIFQVGGETGNKWILKSSKSEVTKTIEVEKDVIVDSKGRRVSSEKHGHSAPFGPTISKIPEGEA